MNRKKILIPLLITMILLLFALIIYVLINKNAENKINIKDTANKILVEERIRNRVIEDEDIDFSDDIINDIVTSYSYDDNGAIRNIEINDDKLLNIDDEIIDESIKFKTLYDKIIEHNGINYLFLISEDDELYSLNLTNLLLEYIVLDTKITNFTNLKYDGDTSSDDLKQRYILVYGDDEKVYDAFSTLKYTKSQIMLFDSLLIYDDNVINSSGYFITKKDDGNYKFKYILMTDDNSELIFITEDDKYIFSYTSENFEYIYEIPVKISNVSYDKNTNDLNVIFENKKEINSKASCNKYFCFD